MDTSRPIPQLIYWIKVFLVSELMLHGHVEANWMYLGISAVSSSIQQPVPGDTCGQLQGLVFQQLEVCRDHPESLVCVWRGAQQGIVECQNQFHNERWNCSTDVNATVFDDALRKGAIKRENEIRHLRMTHYRGYIFYCDLYGTIVQFQGTRETAFIYAILSAGVVHATTRSCSVGDIKDCTCDMSRYGEHDVEGWKWGGCSDNIHYGLWFSKTFVDAPELMRHKRGRNIRSMMNLHNNQVGRNVTESLMRLKCRCHGVSGSCAVKTCWRSLPHFREIGMALKGKYEMSVPIKKSKGRSRRREKTKRRQPITTDDLVYVHKSPNYCRPNPKKGILGTSGRICNKTSEGGDSCSMLCCGRGYNTQVVTYLSRCHCKFVWCCRVDCKTCETVMEKQTCK